MKALIILGVLLLTSGCSSIDPYIGISVHSNALDRPEYYAENPIGLFGAEMNITPSYILFVEHQSSIPYLEEGYGLNHIGIKYKFNQQ